MSPEWMVTKNRFNCIYIGCIDFALCDTVHNVKITLPKLTAKTSENLFLSMSEDQKTAICCFLGITQISEML